MAESTEMLVAPPSSAQSVTSKHEVYRAKIEFINFERRLLTAPDPTLRQFLLRMGIAFMYSYFRGYHRKPQDEDFAEDLEDSLTAVRIAEEEETIRIPTPRTECDETRNPPIYTLTYSDNRIDQVECVGEDVKMFREEMRKDLMALYTEESISRLLPAYRCLRTLLSKYGLWDIEGESAPQKFGYDEADRARGVAATSEMMGGWQLAGTFKTTDEDDKDE